MTLCIEIATIIAEVFIAAYLFEHLFSRRRSPWAAIAYYALFGLLLSLSTFVIPMAGIRVFLLLTASLVGNFLVYCPKPLPCFYITLLYYISVVLSDVIGGAILASQHVAMDVSIGGAERLVYNSMAKIINLLLVQLLLLLFQKNKMKALPYSAIPLIFCQLFSAYVCYQCFYSLFTASEVGIFLLVSLCLLWINIVLCVFVQLLERYYEKQTAMIAAEQQKELQLQHYQTMLERQEETRALWHDIKKYFVAIKTLADSHRTDEMDACFQEIEEKFEHINQSVDVGNPVIDSILSYELARATKIGVSVELQIWVDRELRIPAGDLFIIIGNTMDNALDACEQLPEEQRSIHLILRQTNHLLYYELSNPFPTCSAPKAGTVHGYGLRNVRACVAKNQGSFKLEQKGGKYIVSVQLNV